jgi:hypothetical protein
MPPFVQGMQQWPDVDFLAQGPEAGHNGTLWRRGATQDMSRQRMSGCLGILTGPTGKRSLASGPFRRV